MQNCRRTFQSHKSDHSGYTLVKSQQVMEVEFWFNLGGFNMESTQIRPTLNNHCRWDMAKPM